MPKPKGSKAKWRPAPDELIQLFNEALKTFSEAQLRKTFGYPSATNNGNVFAGLHQESMILKLLAGHRSESQKKGARPFETMPGRTMGEFVVVTESVLESKGELNTWLIKSFEYVKSLPPKKRK
jgi:TfoX/Sxy family transcriptional regulator of competence genes